MDRDNAALVQSPDEHGLSINDDDDRRRERADEGEEGVDTTAVTVEEEPITAAVSELTKAVPPQLTNSIRCGSLEVLPLTGDIIDQHRGKKLYFNDGRQRIDYVLVWKRPGTDDEDHRDEFARCRTNFEKSLVEEGLHIEHDKENGTDQEYLKIHAPVPVLKRYCEIMKIRMPMKEMPEEIQGKSVWEKVTEALKCLMLPFQLDKEQVPELPKKFTCAFQRDKEYLFAIPVDQEKFFPHAVRSRIVDYILRRKSYSDNKHKSSYNFGISRLISKGAYTDAYPLHEGNWKLTSRPSIRRLLYQHWARWTNFYKVQPLDYVRTYFGEKIGLYFAWLGFYTMMLIPASFIGIVVFLYGLAYMETNTIAREACDFSNNFTMCPQCDRRCPYWNYALSCNHVKASYMFDNGATVFFAVFMSLWGTVFLEFWKRSQASIQFQWNLVNFEEEEEPPRPEFLVKLSNSPYKKQHPITGVLEPFLPFWRRKVPKYVASFTTMLFLVFVAITIVIGVIVYRISVLSALHLRDEEILYKNASIVTTATAACINLIFIFILNYFYSIVAEKLTDWECQRTQSEYDNSLTVKLYLLQFVNYYSSIFYVAFFKGRFTGRPGDYNTLFGARQEECQAGGCLIELAIQLAIIFVGKQLIQNNIMEILLPRIRKVIMERFVVKLEDTDRRDRNAWEKDYLLTPPDNRQLFYEYLEMLLQFGFVTIFVAAFPLAPVFALLNNVIEIRGDANKFVTQLRRPMAARAATIGIWYDILAVISKLSVITNSMIIAFTSGFVHRLVYQISYSTDNSLHGFTNNSLAYFNVSDFDEDKKYLDSEGKFNHVTTCRYPDFREPPWADNKYEYTAEFWHIVAAQFMFIVVFENFVFFMTGVIAYMIPDMPQALREWVRREAYLTNEIILRTELQIAQGEGDKDDMTLSLEMLKAIRRRARLQSRPEYHDEPDGAAARGGGEDENDNTTTHPPMYAPNDHYKISESTI